ncbi:hypothetical protein KIW84_030257 [Lathyrus oleraceus]|uniref:Uncharacterized protein n=1 Tax=Pisum sativum TaxID=3888 RepID=A0A9D4XP48_PEA|nr:hypothetical protein KIW84_030257 [Pisum sativum]
MANGALVVTQVPPDGVPTNLNAAHTFHVPVHGGSPTGADDHDDDFFVPRVESIIPKDTLVHSGSHCHFVLWDQESSQILGVSTAQMRCTMIEARINDPLEFPLALGTLLGMEITFKVKWQPHWNSFSIAMILQDEAIINQLNSPWEQEKIKENADEANSDVVEDWEVVTVLLSVMSFCH